MILGLSLALASALATNVAFLLKYRGVLASPVRARHPLRSAAALFRSKWFAVGWLVAVLAWLLHAGALALAPLSIVQAVLSGGLVFLAVLAEPFFGFHLGRWHWFGVTITAAGLLVIGLTAGGATRPQRSSLAALIAVEGAIVAIGAALLAISAHRRVLHRAQGLLLGLAAGALFGVSDVAIKYLTHPEPPAARAREPMGGDRARGGSDLVLRVRPQPPTRAGRRGHRHRLGRREPVRHHRRHPRLRRTHRLRPTRDRGPLPRVLPRHRRRSTDARLARRAA
jgi:hypothetical protein